MFLIFPLESVFCLLDIEILKFVLNFFFESHVSLLHDSSQFFISLLFVLRSKNSSQGSSVDLLVVSENVVLISSLSEWHDTHILSRVEHVLSFALTVNKLIFFFQ